MQAIIIFILIIAILLVIFTLQNSVEITIQLFFWEIPHAPLVLVLVSCLAIGYLLALVYLYPKFWKLRREHRQMIKFNDELKKLQEMNHPKQDETKKKAFNGNPEGKKWA